MRAALYARVSTEEQVSNYSIGVQLETARSLAETRGYRIVGEYVDEGWSGALLNRPALVRLMGDCRLGLIDVIVVYRIDRFFRDARHLLNTMKELESLGVKFVSATEPFDTSTPVGRYLLGQFGLIAELERVTLLERSRAGRLKRAREGKWFGKAPLGYDYIPRTGELVVNPEEAGIVRLAFELYARRGQSLGSVAAELNARGLRTKGGSRWTDATVHDVLTRRLYTGKCVVVVGGVEVPFTAPPIVSQELFDRVQSLLDDRAIVAKYSRKEGRRFFLLASLVRCGCCGSTMGPSSAKGRRTRTETYYYYRCWRQRKRNLIKGQPGRDPCGMGWVRAEQLEEAEWAAVLELITDPAKVKAALEAEKEEAQASPDTNAPLLERLSALAGQRRALIKSFRDGLLPEDDFRRTLQEIAAEEAALQQMLEETRSDVLEMSRHLEQFEVFHRTYRETVDRLTLQERREIVLQLVERVIMNVNGTARVVFTKPPGSSAAFSVTVPVGPPANRRRTKKPGRRPGQEDLTVTFRYDEWEEIRRAAVALQRPVTVVIRDAIEEWLGGGRVLDPGVYRTWIVHENLKRRSTGARKQETIKALKDRSAYSGLPVTEIVRIAVREKLTRVDNSGIKKGKRGDDVQ